MSPAVSSGTVGTAVVGGVATVVGGEIVVDVRAPVVEVEVVEVDVVDCVLDCEDAPAGALT